MSLSLGAPPDFYKNISTRVLKATDPHTTPPKEKHVRAVIIESHQPSTAADCVLVFYSEISKRLATNDPVICLKSLIAMHRVMHEGSPLFLARRTIRADFFERIASAWSTQEWSRGHGKIAIAYLKFLVAKTAPFIPIVVESYAIYTLLVRLMRHIANDGPQDQTSLLPRLLTNFYIQYKELAQFYWEAAQIKYVATSTTVPTLPEEPPTFDWPKKPKEAPKPAPEPPKPPAPEPPKPVPTAQPLLSFDTPLIPVQAPQPPAPQMNPFLFAAPVMAPVAPVMQRSSNPFADLLPSATTMGLAYKPAPAPAPAPEPPPPKVITQVVTRVDMTEINRLKQRIAELEQQVRELRDENIILKDKLKRSGEEVVVLRQSLAKEKEDSAALRKALTDKNPLETALKDMERMLTQEKAASAALQRQLSALQSEAQAAQVSHAESVRQLEIERRAHQELFTVNEQLAKQFAALATAWREDRWARTAEIAAQSATELEDALAQLNSPSTRGNPEATPDDISFDLAELERALLAFLAALSAPPSSADGDAGDAARVAQVQKGIRGVSHSVATLLLDSKGVASGLRQQHQALKTGLIGAAGKVGEASRQAVAAGGNPSHDAQEVARFRTGFDGSSASLRAVLAEIGKALEADSKRSAEDNISIDDAAERELLAAAAQIEALAAQLRASRKQRDPSLPPGEIDVDEAIMEAAIAISQATSLLVAAAAAAQRERVTRGRAAATASRPYVANAVWAEGLISAGRAVASSTHELVGAANRAVQSKGKAELSEEGLIAASHGVAASTAQLVSATRSKSDTSSPSQEKVEDAAKAVSRATALLVEAAKAVALSKQQEAREDYSKLQVNAFRIKEMEQQMLIHRLEKELTSARGKLGEMHRAQYQQP